MGIALVVIVFGTYITFVRVCTYSIVFLKTADDFWYRVVYPHNWGKKASSAMQ